VQSTRGVQYPSIQYTERLAEASVVNVVGCKVTPTTMPWSRASTGSTRPSSSTARAHGANVEHVEWTKLAYVGWFNNRRIHNEIGPIPPGGLEASY
jgi:putative transposase